MLAVVASCRRQAQPPPPSSMFGEPEEQLSPEDYDLADIQSSGELIAVTLSGPDTYYEYRGQGFGLQFDMAEAFARTIGVRLRMEMVPDTASLLSRLQSGEADIVALEFDSLQLFADTIAGQPAQSNPLTMFHPLRSRWLVRNESRHLADAIDRWWHDDTRQRFIEAERQRTATARRVRRRMRPQMLSARGGVISSYDAIFRRHAATIGWDWRLLAAQCYQESGFDPQAVSWAGAQGLMQIMPATAAHLGLPRSEVYNPERNIEAATRYLHELTGLFSDIRDPRERVNFVLAAYNGGHGHVRDAMMLAQKHGRNPHRWDDVDPYILALASPAYYRDPAVRFGYLRGSETSDYVRRIRARWNVYRGAAQPAPTSLPSKPNTRVRPRSSFINDSI